MGQQIDKQVAIIGTGPSGTATRWALQALNVTFVVFDANLREESEFLNSTGEQIVRTESKLKFGSDLPYRHFRYGPIIQTGNTKIRSSFTKGGLSEVWGATLLPYQQDTIEKWGLRWQDFENAYNFILKRLPYASFSNNPKSGFGEYGRPKRMHIHPLFHNATKIKTNINQIEFGASRLAIQVKDSEGRGCYYCNQCLNGCPDGYIWSASHSQDELSPGDVNTRPGIRVIEIYEKNEDIYVKGISEEGRLEEIGPFGKVFLGCGPIETFRILSQSGYIPNTTLLYDSPTFYFPLISRKFSFSSQGFGIALSQLYCHLQGNPDKSEFHFQVYAQSDALIERIINMFPPAKLIPRSIWRILTKRVLVCIGYRESGADTQIRVTRAEDGGILCEDGYKVSKFQLKKEIRKRLFLSIRDIWKAGFLFTGLGIKVGAPGEGVHYGANLQHDSSITHDGKIIKSNGIYVVDSSALQSISAGPITLTIMANAYRIAKGAFS